MVNFITRIKRWFRPRLTDGSKYVDETPGGKLYEQMTDACPACQGHPSVWIEGPAGGACVNVFCAYCGQGYNITPMVETAEQIHKDKRYIEGNKNVE